MQNSFTFICLYVNISIHLHHNQTTSIMKTNISEELKQGVAASIERGKNVTITPFKPYVSKPNPTPAYQNMPAYKAKIEALRNSLNR